MKRKVFISLVILLFIGFIFYKVAIEPVRSNQKAIDVVSSVITTSLDDIDGYKKIELEFTDRTIVKEVQKYQNGDYYIKDTVTQTDSFVMETICIDDNLYATSNSGEYAQSLAKVCYDDFGILDINLTGLLLDEYDDDLINFDYYDDYTVVYFDESIYESADLSSIHPMLKDAKLSNYQVTVYNDNRVEFAMEFEKSTETIAVVLEINNSKVLSVPKLNE